MSFGRGRFCTGLDEDHLNWNEWSGEEVGLYTDFIPRYLTFAFAFYGTIYIYRIDATKACGTFRIVIQLG